MQSPAAPATLAAVGRRFPPWGCESGDEQHAETHKVFCVGFQKTGTTSMEAALEILGYRTASIYGRDWPLARLQAEYVSHGLDLATRYDAVQDMPWPADLPRARRRLPGVEIHPDLRDTDRWLASITGHFGANPAVLQQLTYGADAAFPVGHEARYREVYERHNAEIRRYFADRPPGISSTSTSAAAGGWEPICAFLGELVPAIAFPRSNSALAAEPRPPAPPPPETPDRPAGTAS